MTGKYKSSAATLPVTSAVSAVAGSIGTSLSTVAGGPSRRPAHQAIRGALPVSPLSHVASKGGLNPVPVYAPKDSGRKIVSSKIVSIGAAAAPAATPTVRTAKPAGKVIGRKVVPAKSAAAGARAHAVRTEADRTEEAPAKRLDIQVRVIDARSGSGVRRTKIETRPQELELDNVDEAEDELEAEIEDENAGLRALANAAAVQARIPVLADPNAQQDPVLARRDQVVLEHLPLVKAIAVRVHENLPVHVDLDDLVHAGVLGLFDAASKFNPDKQVVFSSYAKHRIKGAILDSLRQLDWASRDMRRRHKQLEAATRELASKLQRNPTEAEVAEKLGMDSERWRSMMLDLRNVGLISASTRANESEDLPAPDFPSSPDTHPDSICSHEQLRSMLAVAVKTLPERYQKVVSLYYSGELTMKEIGGMLGINESRVSQIHKSALEKMQVVMQANGITSAHAF